MKTRLVILIALIANLAYVTLPASGHPETNVGGVHTAAARSLLPKTAIKLRSKPLDAAASFVIE